MENTTSDTIKEILIDGTKKTTETIKTRIKNPFIFSYLISLILINWKPISIFFKSKLDIYSTIDAIENNKYEYNTNHSYIYPLLIATAYTFGLPIIEGLRSLMLDLVENLKLYSTTIQIKNFEKKQKFEMHKSDLTKRNSLSNKILELEKEKSQLLAKLESTTLNLKSSEIELTGIKTRNKNLETRQENESGVIQNLKDEQNKNLTIIGNYESELNNVIRSNNELKNKYENTLNEIKIVEKSIRNNGDRTKLENELNELKLNHELTKEYQKFKSTKRFNFFRKIMKNEKNSIIYNSELTFEELEFLVKKDIIKYNPNAENKDKKIELTHKGLIFLNEYKITNANTV
jgi:chromosome segregation ATPase